MANQAERKIELLRERVEDIVTGFHPISRNPLSENPHDPNTSISKDRLNSGKTKLKGIPLTIIHVGRTLK